jgi:DNA-binding cell septation regulator SpoVG
LSTEGETVKGPVPKPQSIDISDVQFTAAPPADVERGLVGFTRLTLNGVLRLDGIAVRRTLEGHMTLSFPARRDRTGREHKLVRPVNAEIGREIEYQVLEALGYGEGNP